MIKNNIKEFCEELATFYYFILNGDVKMEADALGVCPESIYAYRNPGCSGNVLKAHQIPFSLHGIELMDFIARRMDLILQPSCIPGNLNGSVDDEWAELSQLFASIRQKFLDGVRYDGKLIHNFKIKSTQLIEEWRGKE